MLTFMLNLIRGKKTQEPPSTPENPCSNETSPSVREMCRQCRIRHIERMLEEKSCCIGKADD